MSLTALTRELNPLNPSLLMANGKPRLSVSKQCKAAQDNGGLYCYHCYRRTQQFLPVRFRNAETKRAHFYHPRLEGAQKECENFSGESEKHLFAKTAIEARLRIQGLTDVSFEVKLIVDFSLGRHRQPDLLVTYPNGALEAHEVQISPLTLAQLQERTADLKRRCGGVVWYLHGEAYSVANREWLDQNGIKSYRLFFVNNDAAEPKWVLGERKKEQTHNGQTNDDWSKLDKKTEKAEVVPNFANMHVGEKYQYTGSNNALIKQYGGLTLTVLSDNGALANCQSGAQFFASVPLYSCRKVC
jgi:hypothetical protein